MLDDKMMNLRARFPDVNEDMVSSMLFQHDGHAGRVASKLGGGLGADSLCHFQETIQEILLKSRSQKRVSMLGDKVSNLKVRFPHVEEDQLGDMLAKHNGHAGLLSVTLSKIVSHDTAQRDETSDASTTAHVMMMDGSLKECPVPFGMQKAVQSLRDAIAPDAGGQVLVIEENDSQQSLSLLVRLPNDGGEAACVRLEAAGACSEIIALFDGMCQQAHNNRHVDCSPGHKLTFRVGMSSNSGQQPVCPSTTSRVMMMDGSVKSCSLQQGLAKAIHSLKSAIEGDKGGQVIVVAGNENDRSASLLVRLPHDGGIAACARLQEADPNSALFQMLHAMHLQTQNNRHVACSDVHKSTFRVDMS